MERLSKWSMEACRCDVSPEEMPEVFGQAHDGEETLPRVRRFSSKSSRAYESATGILGRMDMQEVWL